MSEGLTMRHPALRCCCCGEDAGRFVQHWNRDTGYGICRPCVEDEIRRGTSAQEIRTLYGIEGRNYAAPATEAGPGPAPGTPGSVLPPCPHGRGLACRICYQRYHTLTPPRTTL
jgi:hypothetical protein